MKPIDVGTVRVVFKLFKTTYNLQLLSFDDFVDSAYIIRNLQKAYSNGHIY